MIIDSFEFSKKYDTERAKNYYYKHLKGRRRLTSWREKKLLEKLLVEAGDPQSVLDLPCGAGRFWPVLTRKADRKIIAADSSQAMLNIASTYYPVQLDTRMSLLHCSADAIKLKDNAVESIVCMRLLHHIGKMQDRLRILREMHRVTQKTVILSLWVDGNLKSISRKKSEEKRSGDNYNRFLFERRQIESEFNQAGFKIASNADVLPFISMWRFYLLVKE